MKPSPGLQIAPNRPMSETRPVIPVKDYGRADFQALQTATVDATPPDMTQRVAELVTTNKRLRDKIARMEEMIQEELRYWKRGLEYGDWENREQLKRRMSRLRGAVEYIGTETGWRVTER
jgi:hypothetical protein